VPRRPANRCRLTVPARASAPVAANDDATATVGGRATQRVAAANVAQPWCKRGDHSHVHGGRRTRVTACVCQCIASGCEQDASLTRRVISVQNTYAHASAHPACCAPSLQPRTVAGASAPAPLSRRGPRVTRTCRATRLVVPAADMTVPRSTGVASRPPPRRIHTLRKTLLVRRERAFVTCPARIVSRRALCPSRGGPSAEGVSPPPRGCPRKTCFIA